LAAAPISPTLHHFAPLWVNFHQISSTGRVAQVTEKDPLLGVFFEVFRGF
jgi:hypothetical protein